MSKSRQEIQRTAMRKYNAKRRERVIAALGGRCMVCKRRERVIAALGGRCMVCGTKKDLNIAHKWRYRGRKSPSGSRGGTRNIVDAVTAIKNGEGDLRFALLCDRHHKSLDTWFGKSKGRGVSGWL